MDIKTFIFLDSETTGLPCLDNNTTKITELCLAAIRANHVEMERPPRIQNKLTLCINPEKLIDDKVHSMTGLSNDLLSGEATFNEKIFSMIQNFINLQQKPICFVAHNGDGFDYPILRAEIYKSGNELAGDILCVDSIQAFKGLGIKPRNRRYRLVDIYTTLIQRVPTTTHRAESDVNLLVKCCAFVGKKFVEWCNINAKKFSDISMMTSNKTN